MDKDKIESIVTELQDALIKGWNELKTYEHYIYLVEYSKELNESNFLQSKYRGVIPHPSHEIASKLIGKYFLQVLIKNSINIDEFFPGNYSKSKETKESNYDVRHFILGVYHKSKIVFKILLSFPHRHDIFDFPKSPTIKLVEIF